MGQELVVARQPCWLPHGSGDASNTRVTHQGQCIMYKVFLLLKWGGWRDKSGISDCQSISWHSPSWLTSTHITQSLLPHLLFPEIEIIIIITKPTIKPLPLKTLNAVLCINLPSLELRTLLPNYFLYYFFCPSCWVTAYCSLINPIFTEQSSKLVNIPCSLQISRTLRI